ncbi:MAG: CBS domain-containing protein [Pseudomonadota bacterium]
MLPLEKKSTLRDLLVKDAMRIQVTGLSGALPIESAIRILIKYKVGALLITDQDDLPVGVVSKTDVMGAYYASMALDTPLVNIMVSPPLFCNPADSLESTLETMRSRRIYRLYVWKGSSERAIGVVAYPDIVGLLYRYCRSCDQSLMNRRNKKLEGVDSLRFKVRDVMTPSVTSFSENDSLSEIIEGLSVNHFGAVLIRDKNSAPVGVISKTDLILAYKRGISLELPARTILSSSPVRSCEEMEFIEDAISQMIFSEVHRFFVYRGEQKNIIGVLSLRDAARLRSGSCLACISSRIKVGSEPIA